MTIDQKIPIFSVYIHTFPNGKRYVGITSRDPETRWKRGKNYRNNIYLTRAFEKYGWDNVQHEIVARGLTKEEAEAKERMLIAFFGSNKPENGYNITSGGECVGKHSIETRRKISEIRKRQSADPMFRQRLSDSHKGHIPWNKGIPMTEEQRKKVRAAKMGCEGTGKRSVICIETGEIFDSLAAAAKAKGLLVGKICQVCRGQRKTTGGLHWVYERGN